MIPGNVVGRPIYHLPGGQWNHSDLRRLLEEILPKNTQLRNYELNYFEPGKPERSLLLNARRMHQGAESRELMLLAIQDVTQQREQEKAIAAHERRLHALTEELLEAEENQREKTALALHDSIGPSLAFAKRELAALEKDVSPEWHDNLRRSQSTDQPSHSTDTTPDNRVEPPHPARFWPGGCFGGVGRVFCRRTQPPVHNAIRGRNDPANEKSSNVSVSIGS